MDFAVVNALGANHWSQTALGSGLAAEEEDKRKRRHNNMEARCTERGLTFWPVVFEQQGGQSKAAYAVTRAIAEAVAIREGSIAADIQQEINQRVAILLARATASMISRRQLGGHTHLQRPWRAQQTLVMEDDEVDEGVDPR